MNNPERNYFCTGTKKSPNYLCKFGKKPNSSKWGWCTVHIFPTSIVDARSIGIWRFLNENKEKAYNAAMRTTRTIRPFYHRDITKAIQHIYDLKREADNTEPGKMIFDTNDPFYEAIYKFNGTRGKLQLAAYRELLFNTNSFRNLYVSMEAAPEDAYKIMRDDFTTSNRQSINASRNFHADLKKIIIDKGWEQGTDHYASDKSEIAGVFLKLVAEYYIKKHPEYRDNPCNEVTFKTDFSPIPTEILKMYSDCTAEKALEERKEPTTCGLIDEAFFEKVPTIMGTKAKNMSDEEIYRAIIQAEKRIKFLQSMKHKPKSALKEAQKLHKQLNKLVTWMDENR